MTGTACEAEYHTSIHMTVCVTWISHPQNEIEGVIKACQVFDCSVHHAHLHVVVSHIKLLFNIILVIAPPILLDSSCVSAVCYVCLTNNTSCTVVVLQILGLGHIFKDALQLCSVIVCNYSLWAVAIRLCNRNHSY